MSKREWAFKLIKNVVKAGVTMGLVGALLAATWPAVAPLVGVEGAAFAWSKVADVGGYFGLFGAISAFITPAVNYVFGERASKTVTAKTLGVRSRTLGYEQAPDVSAAHAHAAAPDPSIAATQVASATHFQDMVMASRAGIKPPHIG